MRVHFIAIGGSVMHNLAIALDSMGHQVSGSDDEIFNPAKDNLDKNGLLPSKMGWDPEKITLEIDAIILGMHAQEDNPELIQAKKLDLNIYSFPEFIYQQSRDKKRVVIAGSHGKTTITSMIMHVLKQSNLLFDYLVGAQLEGFETMVKIDSKSTHSILEGDEYLTSPLDLTPKFLHYHPHIAVISGIAWDHINVFPTFKGYVEQFQKFILSIQKNGYLIYNNDDTTLRELLEELNLSHLNLIPYSLPNYTINDGAIELTDDNAILSIFGKHNLYNLQAARAVCELLAINSYDFLSQMQTFKGAAKRLEKVWGQHDIFIYRDFAHAPSKVKASIQAIRELYPNHQFIGCIELHTYSSLSKSFLPEYKGCTKEVDVPIVFYDQHAVSLKRLPEINEQDIITNFQDERILVTNSTSELDTIMLEKVKNKTVILFMSSGNLGGIDIKKYAIVE